MLEFYLNNTRVTDPINWEDFDENIVRDYDVRGIVMKYNVDLKFGSDGYNFLYNIKQTSGFCNEIALRVMYRCGSNGLTQIMDAIIFVSDCRFNLNKCTAECPVEDNGYSALIHNNKKLKAKLDVGTSKNEVAITQCTNIVMHFIQPSTGTFAPHPYDAYDAADALRFLIAYMTDGAVGFISDWYTNLPADGKIAIMKGEEIRLGANVSENRPNVFF